MTRLSLYLVCLAASVLPGCEGDDDPDDDPIDTDVIGDMTAPTVSVVDDAEGVASGPVTFTLSFSEDIGQSLELADLVVDGGEPGELTWEGQSATLVVTPPDDALVTLQVTVPAESFEDLAGNLNVLDASASRRVDTRVGAAVPGTTLFDFEPGSEITLFGFGAARGTLAEDPTDASNQVATLTKPSSAELWAGVTLGSCPNDGIPVLPVATGHTVLTARFWSPDADIPVRLKVEDSQKPEVSVETEARTTVAEAWETLVFDLSEQALGTSSLDPDATYDKVSVFPNFGTTGATAGTRTYHIDDLRFEGVSFDTGCPAITEPSNRLDNAGFEVEFAGDDPVPEWLAFPEEATRYGLTPAISNFVPLQGKQAMFVYGQNTGAENFTAIYQEYPAEQGERFTMATHALMFGADPFVTGDSYAMVTVKFFTDDYIFLGQARSERVTSKSPIDTWIQLEATGTVPRGATLVQGSIELWQCEGAESDCFSPGVVLFDVARFYKH